MHSVHGASVSRILIQPDCALGSKRGSDIRSRSQLRPCDRRVAKHDRRGENHMELGITLPHMGRYAGASALIKSAQLAEQLGYSAVWAADRLLYPLQPKSRYPVTADGSLPEFYKTVLDPIETLTFVAAHTYRIRLGTS